jgi:hypothetical protein
MSNRQTGIIELSDTSLESAEIALVRLGALFPEVSFELADQKIVFDAPATENSLELRKEILNCVYRQTIFEKTIDIRKKIFGL